MAAEGTLRNPNGIPSSPQACILGGKKCCEEKKKVPPKCVPQKAQMCADQQKLVNSQQSGSVLGERREIRLNPFTWSKALGKSSKRPT